MLASFVQKWATISQALVSRTIDVSKFSLHREMIGHLAIGLITLVATLSTRYWMRFCPSLRSCRLVSFSLYFSNFLVNLYCTYFTNLHRLVCSFLFIFCFFVNFVLWLDNRFTYIGNNVFPIFWKYLFVSFRNCRYYDESVLPFIRKP